MFHNAYIRSWLSQPEELLFCTVPMLVWFWWMASQYPGTGPETLDTRRWFSESGPLYSYAGHYK